MVYSDSAETVAPSHGVSFGTEETAAYRFAGIHQPFCNADKGKGVRIDVTADVIKVCAVVIQDPDGRLLCVRKQGSQFFMQPGGKPEAGETSQQTVIREVREELGVELQEEKLRFLGVHSAQAANEHGFTVQSTLFSHPYTEACARISEGQAEIAEVAWFSLDDAAERSEALAPLLRERIIPAITRRINSVAVFTGARPGVNEKYVQMAQEFGRQLAYRGLTLVYGGGKVGLMGAVADAALEAGGHVVGVIPQHLVDGEVAHPGLTELHVVDNMLQRKQMMAELSDAFVALPGGTGTLDEVFDVWTGQQLGTHRKPIALCGSSFWQPLVESLGTMAAEGFIRQTDIDSLIVSDGAKETLSACEVWQPQRPRWAQRS